MKNIILISLMIALLGCNAGKTKAVYQERILPVYTVPMPPEVTRPELAIDKLTDEQKQNDGVYGKALTLSIEDVNTYIKQLELIISTYKEIAIAGAAMMNNNPAIVGVQRKDGFDVLRDAYGWPVDQWNRYFQAKKKFDQIEKVNP